MDLETQIKELVERCLVAEFAGMRAQTFLKDLADRARKIQELMNQQKGK
jgi:hypothetical protein